VNSNLEVDVINICTPNFEHAAQSIKALRAGYHVVCEKPMALSTADCQEVIDEANLGKKNIFCVMQNRYSPSAQWLKNIINNKQLGAINLVLVNCFWNRGAQYYSTSPWRGKRKLDGGTLFTQFSHFIDTLYWLFGDLSNLQAKLKNFNHQSMIEFEDTGIITFDIESGGAGCLSYSTSAWDKNFESSIIIMGEKGSVKVGGQYMNKVEYCHISDYALPEMEECLPPNDYGTYKGSAANHHFVIENVIDTLKGRGNVDVRPEEGMKVVEIIEKIYSVNKEKTLDIVELELDSKKTDLNYFK
ncbi:MAG TPA: Gfo/Idh/MocA family oxidoreductase, partial [Cytophagaceae bacterium]|jgi:predicted dehydrogenase